MSVSHGRGVVGCDAHEAATQPLSPRSSATKPPSSSTSKYNSHTSKRNESLDVHRAKTNARRRARASRSPAARSAGGRRRRRRDELAGREAGGSGRRARARSTTSSRARPSWTPSPTSRTRLGEQRDRGRRCCAKCAGRDDDAQLLADRRRRTPSRRARARTNRRAARANHKPINTSRASSARMAARARLASTTGVAALSTILRISSSRAGRARAIVPDTEELPAH